MKCEAGMTETGTVFVLGLGPGAEDLMTPRALAVLARCSVIVGYERYVALVPEKLLRGKSVVATGMTREMERCAAALDAARTGADVAVVCSGDPGVYAMAGLVFELAERSFTTMPHIEIVPGVPAVCAAAALLGAPLMHDFACVSLSDLLTPWAVIEKRARCALEGDFVLALYNPRSKKRPDHLEIVLALARALRGPDTPVGMVRLAGRPGQETWTGPLSAFNPQKADMLSLVLIGNKTTRLMRGRMVTPRGYFQKYTKGEAHGHV